MCKLNFKYSIESGVSKERDTTRASIIHLFHHIKADCENSSCKVEVDIIWIDLITLMDDSTIFTLLKKYDNKTNPKIFIGTQSIIELIENPRVKFEKKISQFDNNIWTYYLQLEKKEKFADSLKKVFDEIKFNYAHNLYNLEVSHEYLDYFSRQCKENHLTGGHGSQVVPQVYTPKTIIKDFIKDEFEKINELIPYNFSKGEEIDVKILLIDDFGNSKLKTNKSDTPNQKNKEQTYHGNVKGNLVKGSKSSIFFELWKGIEKLIKLENLPFPFKISIDVLESPTYNKIKDIYYDIILLDYNFNDTKNGIDFLKDLSENTSSIQGPFNKHWIIPITSFSNAFIDEMRMKKLSFVHDNYKLTRGADFIATPHLFYHFFFQMLGQIIKQGIGVKNNIDKIKESIGKAKDWNEILGKKEEAQKMFETHIVNKKNVNFLLKANSGVLKSIKDTMDEGKFKQEMNYFEQLLYNLAYRNYEGNEEIIIYYDLLKNAK